MFLKYKCQRPAFYQLWGNFHYVPYDRDGTGPWRGQKDQVSGTGIYHVKSLDIYYHRLYTPC